MNTQPIGYKAKAFKARNLAFFFLRSLPMKQLSTHKSHYLRLSLFVCLLVLCTIGVLVCNVPASAETEQPPAITATLGDPQELETFIDSVVTKQLEEMRIASAVVVIVKDGQVLLSKGYGYADVEKGIPVNAEHTLFLPGSVTKLFTWTAVMQLVEQGKIDLQADVNTYLTDFQIPATNPQPITMLDLMAHTPGFEETTEGMLTTKPEELTSLGVYLAEYMPRRVFPPGQVPAYSNYGAAIAGYIVEQVSGEAYEQYIEEYIFKPLGMEHSTMYQPLPVQLAPEMALGYIYDGQYEPLPIHWLQVSPAGALSASGADMGKFMLAHLQEGEYNGVRILEPETARLMHTQSYTFDPALPGWAHGFEESTINGRRLIGHGGNHLFSTLLELIPEEKVGFYVSYNAYISPSIDEDPRTRLLAAFMDRYFPAPEVEDDPARGENDPGTDDSQLGRYSGFYTMSRLKYHNPEKIEALYSMIWMRPGPGGTLQRSYVLGFMLEDAWVEIRPMVFQNTRTGGLAAFKADEQGEVRYLRIADEPNSFIRQPWYGGQVFQFGIIAFSGLTFLLTVVAAPIAYFISRRKREAGERSPRLRRLARGLALALCVAFIAFVAVFTQYMNNVDQPILRILVWVVAALALGVTFQAVIAWWKGWWSLAGRLHYTVIALAGLSVTWFLAYWSLLMLP